MLGMSGELLCPVAAFLHVCNRGARAGASCAVVHVLLQSPYSQFMITCRTFELHLSMTLIFGVHQARIYTQLHPGSGTFSQQEPH